MPSQYLTVDGFRSSTGIRDPFSSEYLELETLPVNAAFRHRFAGWLQRYHNAHSRYDQASSEPYLHALDEEGLHLAVTLG